MIIIFAKKNMEQEPVKYVTPKTWDVGSQGGKERYECTVCQKNFVEKDFRNKIKGEEKFLMLLLRQTLSFGKLETIFRIRKQTIQKAIKKILDNSAEKFKDENIHLDVLLENVKCDVLKRWEIMSEIGKKPEVSKPFDWLLFTIDLGKDKGNIYVLKPVAEGQARDIYKKKEDDSVVYMNERNEKIPTKPKTHKK